MNGSPSTLWKETTPFERIVVGCGLVSLFGDAFTRGGITEAVTIGGPAVVILAALGYVGAHRLRHPRRRGHTEVPVESRSS